MIIWTEINTCTQEKENKVNSFPRLGTMNVQFYASTLESKHITVL